MSTVRVLSTPLGGGALAARAIVGDAPEAWYPRRPATPDEWRLRGEAVRRAIDPGWLERLAPALDAKGAARSRLERVAHGGGVLVTTGQQPALFGGPMYTWSKAIAAVELADAVERATGIPCAAVYWAATDDADYAEAAATWVSLPGGARRLTMSREATEGIPMADVQLGDLGVQLATLAEASRSAVHPRILDAVRAAYDPSATIGGAFLALLRTLLEPLGIAVLDASHDATLAAGRPLLLRALTGADDLASALASRSIELRAGGVEPQVAAVDGLSMVFTRVGVRKARIPLSEARGVASMAAGGRLSPNVLLRPVMERALLPTVAYVAGPGELAYFAQVSAVARSLGAEVPLAVPRWSATILEPHVEELLKRHGVSMDELAVPHAVEGRLARASIPVAVSAAIASLRSGIDQSTDALRGALSSDEAMLLDDRVLEGTARLFAWRVDRLERRVVAAAKRRDSATMHDVATMRGALYPAGVRQERALNLMPILARHGEGVIDDMRMRARLHAEALVHGGPIPTDAS